MIHWEHIIIWLLGLKIKAGKGENPLRGQIGPIKQQNIKNIQERVITPQYNVEVL